tara:strand:- start:436 stop:609 length:174 start_codon:yes stop_codon:yes gene_type:complete
MVSIYIMITTEAWKGSYREYCNIEVKFLAITAVQVRWLLVLELFDLILALGDLIDLK